MIRLIPEMCRQVAVYWAPAGNDNFGQPTYADPIELAPPNGVRWEDITSEYLDAAGAKQVSNSRVFVLQDVAKDGVLWLGALADLDASRLANPFLNSGAWTIAAFSKIPTLKADQFLRTATLGGRGSM